MGIIPAYAGSTFGLWISSEISRDHPRVCGEHNFTHSFQIVALGSSPRMRGAQDWKKPIKVQVGIIPAYAGSTI